MALFLRCSRKKIKATINSLKKIIVEEALKMGFNDVGFVSTEPLVDSEKNFLKWREKGLAGDMSYLLRDNPVNARPNELFKEAKSIIVFTVNYYTPCPPMPSLEHGRVAAYAVGLDYHKVIKKKLKALLKKLSDANYLKEKAKELNINFDEINSIFKNSKIFTDAVPLLEKSFAKKAGLGFKGKSTMLISKQNGSFNFIAEILTDIEFEPGPEITKHNVGNTCGSCVKCIDICPTDALIDGHKIDARKCISYLTIENKGLIDGALAKNMGEWLYGCDDCQTVCPYNSKSLETPWTEFRPESGVGHWLYLPAILFLDPINNGFSLSKDIENKINDFYKFKKLPSLTEDLADEIFHEKFCHTPITRAGRKGLIRNAMIRALNSKAPESLKLIQSYLNHNDPVLKATADLALGAS